MEAHHRKKLQTSSFPLIVAISGWVSAMGTSAHLIVHTHTRSIHHAVAPISAGNSVLLLAQVHQFLVAATHVLIQGGQVVPAG